jgi:hypothetical protein
MGNAKRQCRRRIHVPGAAFEVLVDFSVELENPHDPAIIFLRLREASSEEGDR